MAKKTVPAKPKAKTPVKTPAKPAKAAGKAASKPAQKATDAPSEKLSLKDRVKAGLKALVKPNRAETLKSGPANEKSTEKSKKKAKKAAASEDEDFLSEPSDTGAEEELPDLTDFDVEEPEVVEDDTDDDLDDDEELLAEPQPSDEIILTDAEGRRYCKVKECDQAASVDMYCRYHYLLLWKRIQIRRKILDDGKLEKYVEDLTSRYPDKFLEMIRRDLKTEKDFMAAIAELEIDESALDSEFEDEAQNYIEEVRGVSGDASISDDDEF